MQLAASHQVIVIASRALGLPAQPQASRDEIRDALVSCLVVGGTFLYPLEVVGLLCSFLRRLSLPRLVHFLDMILAQMDR